ncbi:MAG: undecaprenyldiphospho-muramoylpentapeptide beta-N-acetylglucosaminyltransferase [Bacilli bacterium]|nr:undecaprenyldiphospho-muramoylpentapeptide beta-N-acetylglucosaminyltransferase [Bacilli bacterium]
MKMIITAGGTMGHINPALAIIEEFKKHDKSLEVLYIGTHNRMEKDVIPSKGIAYEGIQIYGFSKDLLLDIKNIFYIHKATKRCIEIMKNFKPDIVIGVGGYVTYPVLKAAKKLGIKTAIHEQNSIPGKSNKMIAKYADFVAVTFESSIPYFKTNGKILVTGHPCGAWALAREKLNKESLGFHRDKKLVTVVAGSLGSGSLNHKFLSVLKKLEGKDYEVCYITGKGHYEEMKEENVPKNVEFIPYCDNLPGLMKVSDLVVSRAGAGSLSEILSLEIPSLIIPSPNVANNHQYYNAKELQDKGCIELLEEKDITEESLLISIEDCLYNKEKRLKMIHSMKLLDTKNSSLMIYENIKEMISK